MVAVSGLRPAVIMLLAASGALLAHALGYFVGPGPGHLGHDHAMHGYLGTLTTTLGPFAAAALMSAARQTAAKLAKPPSVAAVLAAQLSLFATQEVLERLAHGQLGTLLDEPAVAAGLLFQLPCALLVVALVRLAGRVIAATAEAGTALPCPRGSGRRLAPARNAVVSADTPARWVRRRGPPLLA